MNIVSFGDQCMSEMIIIIDVLHFAYTVVERERKGGEGEREREKWREKEAGISCM